MYSASLGGIHAKSVFFFNIFSGDPHVDALIIGCTLMPLLGLPNYWSDSWRGTI